MFSIRATGHFYPVEGKQLGPVRPYLGVGIGGVWLSSSQQVADLYLAHNSFNFILTPEVGAFVTLVSAPTKLALNASFRYTYTTADPRGANNAQFVSEQIGLAWYF